MSNFKRTDIVFMLRNICDTVDNKIETKLSGIKENLYKAYCKCTTWLSVEICHYNNECTKHCTGHFYVGPASHTLFLSIANNHVSCVMVDGAMTMYVKNPFSNVIMRSDICFNGNG